MPPAREHRQNGDQPGGEPRPKGNVEPRPAGAALNDLWEQLAAVDRALARLYELRYYAPHRRPA